jgi:transketolase
MRNAFIQSLLKIASQDGRVMLITGDLGYLVVEEFMEKFPDRFLNAGVAEQNLLGLATGLAEAGFIPFVYSITPFITLRPFEFIRNGPVYHNLPVRIVGIGQGVEYGMNGLSHYALEDIGVLRTQPGLTIIAPADDAQAKNAIEQTYHHPGPIYFRLSKEKTTIPELLGNFTLGEAQQIGNGRDFVIVSTGAITTEAVKAVHTLSDWGINGTILVVASLAPAPEKNIVNVLVGVNHVFTLEAHYITGGVGSLVAEIIAENGLPVRLTRFGFTHLLNKTVGSAASICAENGLSGDKLAARIQKVLQNA